MPHDLKHLTKLAARARIAIESRDAAIVAARTAGVPLRTIADATGLSHTGVAKIVARSTE